MRFFPVDSLGNAVRVIGVTYSFLSHLFIFVGCKALAPGCRDGEGRPAAVRFVGQYKRPHQMMRPLSETEGAGYKVYLTER